jgi:hypothetical protein
MVRCEHDANIFSYELLQAMDHVLQQAPVVVDLAKSLWLMYIQLP